MDKDKKIESLIDKLKREIQYKKSLAVRKSKIEKEPTFPKFKSRVVMNLGETLFRKIEEESNGLNISKQKMIESILLKHYGLLRRK